MVSGLDFFAVSVAAKQRTFRAKIASCNAFGFNGHHLLARVAIMKFYDCLTAPSPRRVRMFIAEKKVELPVVEVDLGKREQHESHFERINPYRTVPVLELDDGSVLTSSTAIVHYLESVYPTPALIGESPAERARIMDLDWRIENEGFMAVGEAFRNRAKSFANNALTGRHEYSQIPALSERGSVRTVHFFDWLNVLLEDRQYVAGDQFTLTDITAFVTVEFAKWIKQQPAPEHVHLSRWHSTILERDSASV